ncbi:MAG: phosphate ABC transporter permease subunit PstC [Rhodospirillaceae bacterium]|nr:MAG: phosphate ABC transporter permease subunit PstC [Rhodospirillaceae bacterium]
MPIFQVKPLKPGKRTISKLFAAALGWGLAGIVGFGMAAGSAAARDQITIVGSSTVYPFATTVAEQFGRSSAFKSPVVESTGTGGGLKLFCNGAGDATPDIADASRPIKDSERQTCAQNGVTDILEVPVGFDGIALVNGKSKAPLDLTVKDIWLALAREVPVNGKLVKNPYKTWAEVNPSLPPVKIEVLGPPPTSGTRDAFVELVFDRACGDIAEIAAISDEKARKAACDGIREDGAYIDAGENDNLIVQKLEANPDAFGVLGYSFLIQNQDKLQGNKIGGIAPTEDDILSGRYEVARQLYLYVKMQHLDTIPGLPEYVAEFVSNRANGPGGYLIDKGLIPMSADLHKATEDRILAALGYENGVRNTSPAFILPARVMPVALTVALLGLAGIGFQIGRRRAIARARAMQGNGRGFGRALHSLPGYHGLYVMLWCLIPGLLAFVVGAVLVHGSENADRAWAAIAAAVLALAAIGLVWARRHIRPDFRARNLVERAILVLLITCSLLSILTTVGIVLSLLFEAMRFFARVPFTEFLFGLQWSPQIALRADQVGASGSFGAIPIFAGTLLITVIAMIVAVPIGLMSAVYLSDYANPKVRAVVKPLLEILAGIPTVVYGFFAALTVAPFLRSLGATIGLDVASESALAAGVVMGVMIIPFVSSLSDDVMNAVPQSLRDGSYALGSTKSETIRQVVFPAALPGIVGSILLAVSRAIGETMIVVMAAGLTANLTANPFAAVTTVTVQIVTLLVGDQEFDSPKTLAAFALGLVLFVITLCLNIVALRTVRKYREKYD